MSKRNGGLPATWPALTQLQRDRALLGFCPFCEMNVRAHQFPMSEKQERLLERAKIDAATGHQEDCQHREIRL